MDEARKYVTALASGLERVNGWTIAEECGDRSPDATQRLLNRASWDQLAAISEVADPCRHRAGPGGRAQPAQADGGRGAG